MVPIKEPKYWSPDIPNPAFISQTIESYLSLFGSASLEQSIVGDASTSYLASRVALTEIIRFSPAAKFIALVRDPLTFLPAYHSELCMTFHEDVVELEKAWELQERRRQGESVPRGCVGPLRLDYQWAASFGEQIRRLMELIPAPQRMVLTFDDLCADSGMCYERVLSFLEVPSDSRTSFEHAHSRRSHRFQLLRRLWIRPPSMLSPLVIPMRRVLGAGGLNLSRHVSRLMTKPGAHVSISAEFRDELCRVFADDVRLLEELLGRNLDSWLDGALTAGRVKS